MNGYGDMVGPVALLIRGGVCRTPASLAALWAALPWSEPGSTEPICLVEHHDRVTLDRTRALPSEMGTVRRLRAFTPAADLTLLPAPGGTRWWLLADAALADALPEGEDFWSDVDARTALGWPAAPAEGGEDGAALLAAGERRSRLWGRPGDHSTELIEPRIASRMPRLRDELKELGLAPGEAAVIVSQTYYAAGRPQFVRFLRLEPAGEGTS